MRWKGQGSHVLSVHFYSQISSKNLELYRYRWDINIDNFSSIFSSSASDWQQLNLRHICCFDVLWCQTRIWHDRFKGKEKDNLRKIKPVFWFGDECQEYADGLLQERHKQLHCLRTGVSFFLALTHRCVKDKDKQLNTQNSMRCNYSSMYQKTFPCGIKSHIVYN